MIGHWLAHVFGLDNLSGPLYGFWSGLGSDLGELPMLGAAVTLARRHNCHYPRCARIGRFPVEGTPWTVCAKHHPVGAPTREDINAGGAP